jgi:hypothetical protein
MGRLVLQGYNLELESAPEMVASGLGLMSAAEAGPVQRVVDGVRRVAHDVEQASDLGDGEWDHSPALMRDRHSIPYC